MTANSLESQLNVTKNRVLLVAGKPRVCDFKRIENTAKERIVGILINDSSFDIARGWYSGRIWNKSNGSQAAGFIDSSVILDYDSFFSSKHFLDALLISERAYPKPVGMNDAIGMIISACRYASYILYQSQPDIVVFDNIPHDLQALTVYIVAKQRSIPVRVFVTAGSPLESLVYVCHDIGVDFNKKYPLVTYVNSGHFKFNCQTAISAVSSTIGEYNLKSTHPRLKLRWYQARLHARLKALFKIKSLNDKYFSFKDVPENKYQKYILCLLHYQPEATTMPMGSAFALHSHWIGTLFDGALDFTVVIKEHPAMFEASFDNLVRYRTALSNLLKSSSNRVVVVPPWSDTRTLIKNSFCVATINGTSISEAFVLNKPVLVFGQTVFSGFKWARECRSSSDVSTHLSVLRNEKLFESISQEFKLFLDETVRTASELQDVTAPDEKERSKSFRWMALNKFLESDLGKWNGRLPPRRPNDA
jgi:hypothetical protein